MHEISVIDVPSLIILNTHHIKFCGLASKLVRSDILMVRTILKIYVVILSHKISCVLLCPHSQFLLLVHGVIVFSYLYFKACQLPLFEYLVEKMCSLCYDRAWYAKYGG